RNMAHQSVPQHLGGGVGGEMKLQTSSFKLQGRAKIQAPIEGYWPAFRVGVLRLRFLWSLVLGAWCLAINGSAATNQPPPFHHPGVLVNRAQLELIKARVAAGTEPQKSAFEAAKASPLGAAVYTPHPWATCECGPR